MRRGAVRAWILGGSALLGLAAGQPIHPAQAAEPSTAQQCNAAYEKAQVLRRARKLRAAHDELVTCSQSKCPGAITADCGPWLREVESSMPSVVVVARDASGNDVPAVKVSIDGAVVAPRLTGTPIDVDPGEHTFTFEPEQGQRVDQKLLINVGEKNRLIQVPIHAAAPGADKPVDKPRETPPDEGSKKGSIVPGVVIGAVGLASLGASIGLYVDTKSKLDTLHNTCAPSCAASQVDPLKTKGIVSDVTFGVGVAGLGVGALLVILELVKKPAPPAAAQTVIVAPVAGGWMAGLGGHF